MHSREIQAIEEAVDQIIRDLATPFKVKLVDGTITDERPELDCWFIATGYITVLLAEMERLFLLYPLDGLLTREADVIFDREGDTIIERFF